MPLCIAVQQKNNMEQKNTKHMMRKTIKITTAFYIVAIAGTLLLVNACNKNKPDSKQLSKQQNISVIPATDHQPEISTVTIANIHATKDGTSMRVMFNEKEEIFTAQNTAILTTLQEAFKNGQAVTITTDPWNGLVTAATTNTTTSQRQRSSATLLRSTHTPTVVDMATASVGLINNLSDKSIEGLGIAPTDTTHLTNMVPDIATARLMFTYIAQQCCAVPGPYAIDYCIPFQYAIDGCYARAHKMCWILNNKYHYGTQKVFSFALGSDELCVKADKWGGCCVNWWYHVAPLVTVKTPQGPKAYVFDPAMFDQPVLLSVWLGAQQNGTCVSGGEVPHVTMYTIQPTSAFWPADYTGMTFDTDPTFSSTDYYLYDYSTLHTCP